MFRIEEFVLHTGQRRPLVVMKDVEIKQPIAEFVLNMVQRDQRGGFVVMKDVKVKFYKEEFVI